MTSRLKKNNSKSSLDTKYVDNFLKNVESKLYDFNRSFLLPYKKKLDSKDKSVIADIAKDFKSPTLVIKNALDELWNYHWMLGQKDVLNSTSKIEETRSNFEKAITLTTFAVSDAEVISKRKQASAEKRTLQELNKRVIRLKKDIDKKSDRYSKDSLKATLKGITKDLGKFIEDTSDTQTEATAVRIRDLQETIRTLDLKLSEAKSPNPEGAVGGIDILNSTEFGTIYQDKRTLLLAGDVSKDYKQKVVDKIQKYFDNTNGVRSNTREQDLFNSLTDKRVSPEIMKELGEKDTFGIKRIKRIAETEISVAYNIGRLKKLEELGYTRVKITNEKENTTNRGVALSRFGSLEKAYQAKDSERFMPILCTHCLSRNGQVLDIDEVYKGKVDTKYNGKYSLFPPFHVSCWCYLEGVKEKKKEKIFTPEVQDALVLSGLGLLSVTGAYLAFSKLGKNKIKVPKVLIPAKKTTTNTVSTVNNLLDRPKVNITSKQIEDTIEVLSVSDDVFKVIQSETNTLLRIPVNFIPKTSAQPDLVEELVLNQIDEVLVNKIYKLSNLPSKTVNQIIEDIPDYVQSLRPIINARDEYYRLRNTLYDTSVPLETRQSLYNTYITSRSKYDSLIGKHLEDTRNLKNTVNNVHSQISVDANRQILASRNNLPENVTLEDALSSMRSRNALTLTDNQLKNIRNNLTLERKGLREKIVIESKVLDSSLNGIDTQQKALDLKVRLENIGETFAPNTKALDKVVANITSIKKELNNISKTKDTIRSISTERISSGSILDKQLLIDTQEAYIKKVIAQQKIIAEELKRLPQDNEKLDSFVNLYRSEIQSKVDKSYSYSTGIWSKRELISLRRKYENVSNVVTVRNTYQSYLEETEEMLSKLSNFENTIVDNTLNFSFYEKSYIIVNKEKLNKLLRLPSIKNIVLR